MPLLPAHLEYLIGLEKRGLFVCIRPFDGCWGGTTRWRRVDCSGGWRAQPRRARLLKLCDSPRMDYALSRSRNGL